MGRPFAKKEGGPRRHDRLEGPGQPVEGLLSSSTPAPQTALSHADAAPAAEGTAVGSRPTGSRSAPASLVSPSGSCSATSRRTSPGSRRWARPADGVHRPGHDRHLPGHELPAGAGHRARVDPLHHRRGHPGLARARNAQVGLVGDGHPAVPAHGPHVPVRGLQVPARDDVGHGRAHLHPRDGDGPDRLPAGLRPARLLGHRRGRQHQRHGADPGPLHRRDPEGGRVRRAHARALLLPSHAGHPDPIGGLIALHVWLVMRLGVTSPPWSK